MYLFINIILWLGIFSSFQDDTIKISSNSDLYYIDNLDNVYTIETSILKKYSSKGKLLNSFSNPYYGAINQIDVKDPFRILVFYKEFSQIVFLDAQLSQIGNTIKINDLGIQSASLVCSSCLSGFWVFDDIINQLTRFDRNLQPVCKSIYLDKIIPDGQSPASIFEQNDKVYLNIYDTSIYIFDNFANFSKSIAVKVISQYSINENKICYFTDKQLVEFDIKTNQTKVIDIPDYENIESAICSNRTIVIKAGNYLYLHNINN